MTSSKLGATSTAAALREAFDQTFAQAPRTAEVALDDFLAIRMGGDARAIRVSEITGLYHDRTIVPIIGRAAHFLGIAGFRGMMAPVYDLATLLGGVAAPTPRWLVLTRTPSPVGLAFDLFEAHARLAPDDVHAAGNDDAAGGHFRGVARMGRDTNGAAGAGVLRPIIHIASVLEAIARQMPFDNVPKER